MTAVPVTPQLLLVIHDEQQRQAGNRRLARDARRHSTQDIAGAWQTSAWFPQGSSSRIRPV